MLNALYLLSHLVLTEILSTKHFQEHHFTADKTELCREELHHSQVV